MFWLRAEMGNAAESETGAGIKYVRFGDEAAMPAIVDEWHWRRRGTHDTNGDGAARIGPWESIGWRRVSGGVSAKPRNAYNLRPARSCLLWIFKYNLEPKFLLHSYLSLAVLRLHDTMATINSDNIKFYQPPSTAEPTGKNPMVTFQHKGETAGDTRGGDAGMWNPALIK